MVVGCWGLGMVVMWSLRGLEGCGGREMEWC